MTARRRAALAAGGLATGAVGYALERSVSRRWRVPEEELAAAGLTLPPDLVHHFVAVSDGGRIHVVERVEDPRGRRGTSAADPTVVLLHGVILGLPAWALQLRGLGGRVVALSVRGHGQSRAGTEGYGFDRQGADLLEVLAELDVRDAVVCGHSMSGMVLQQLAAERGPELAGHARRLVLVSTSPRGPGPDALGPALGAVAGKVLARAERRGRGPFPRESTVWLARLPFGARPEAAQVELFRSMLDAMSPSALAGIVPHLLAFDERARLASIALPVHVVVGTRDVLTPPRAARAIARLVPTAELTVLEGCGHMVMLERPAELCRVLS